MPRLLGVDIPPDRPMAISLTYLYGVGTKTARELCHKAGIDPLVKARDLGEDEVDDSFDRVRFLDLLGRYFDTRGLSADWDTLKDAEDELLINSLSMMLEFEAEDKQALLEAPSLETRRETLVTLIEFAMRGGQEEGLMQ